MAIVWTNKKELDSKFKRFEELYNAKSAEWMCRLGEQVVKYAKEHGNYTDRTANLRNSIGYIVVQSGQVVAESFTGGASPTTGGGDEAKAKDVGRTYARKVASEYSRDKTYLVWVAGMEYAAYVEATHDVINGSGDWVKSQARTQMENFRRWLMTKG